MWKKKRQPDNPNTPAATPTPRRAVAWLRLAVFLVALAALVDQALRLGIGAIDCQMTTAHLLRFGARELDRPAFQALLDESIDRCRPQKKWRLP